MNALLKLPFSRKFLLETIKIGCNNRHENVQYSNFLGTWIKLKLHKIKEYKLNHSSQVILSIKE